MASSGKRKTTMAKLNRERRLRERRVEKEARKEARKQAAVARAESGTTWADEIDAAERADELDSAPDAATDEADGQRPADA